MSLGRVLRNTVIAVLALLWLVPTWLLVVNALVPAGSYSGSPHWLPRDFGLFGNMSQAWTRPTWARPSATASCTPWSAPRPPR